MACRYDGAGLPGVGAGGAAEAGLESTALDWTRSVRIIGMASTGAASVSRPSAGYVNPASVAWCDGIELTGVYQNVGYDSEVLEFNLKDIRASFGTPMKRGWHTGVAMGYSDVDFGEGIETLPDGTPLRTVDLIERFVTAAVGVCYSADVASLSFGVAGKYFSAEYFDSHTWLLDAGTILAFSFNPSDGLIRQRVGVSVSNLDTGLDAGDGEYNIAGETRAGFGLDLAGPDVSWLGRTSRVFSSSFDVDWADPTVGDTYWSFGMEFSLVDFVFARIGSEKRDVRGSRGPQNRDAYGFGLGWGVGDWYARAEYARVTRPTTLGEQTNHVFGLNLAKAW